MLRVHVQIILKPLAVLPIQRWPAVDVTWDRKKLKEPFNVVTPSAECLVQTGQSEVGGPDEAWDVGVQQAPRRRGEDIRPQR